MPSVIEPAVMAKGAGWEVKEIAAGWGNYASMMAAAESAIADGPYLLGDQFSMAERAGSNVPIKARDSAFRIPVAFSSR